MRSSGFFRQRHDHDNSSLLQFGDPLTFGPAARFVSVLDETKLVPYFLQLWQTRRKIPE